MARNRKRAKERRARRPQPVVARPERDEAPGPIQHAAPDVELAEAQMALGRPELAGAMDADSARADAELAAADADTTVDELADAELELGAVADDEPELEEPEAEPRGAGGGRDRVRVGAGYDGGDGGGRGRGGAAAAPLPAPQTRPRAGSRLITFLQGSWRELQRVQWPDRRQVIQATGVVIGFVIIAGLFLGLADTVASKLMDFILK